MTTPGASRVMRTPEIEPLTIAPEDRMPNVVALIARAAERNANREALRWKLPKAGRATEDAEAGWTSRTYRQIWDWVTSLSLGLRDGGQPIAAASSMAKWYASDVAMRVTTDAVQIYGGAGYSRDNAVERLMRDAKGAQIYEGTNQIHRLIVAQHLLDGVRRDA